MRFFRGDEDDFHHELNIERTTEGSISIFNKGKGNEYNLNGGIMNRKRRAIREKGEQMTVCQNAQSAALLSDLALGHLL